MSKIVYIKKGISILVVVLVLLTSLVSLAAAQNSVVRIMLFFSPACGHCANLISNDLPPIINPYFDEPELLYIPPTPEEENVGSALYGVFGNSIEILYVNILTERGHGLYGELVELLSIPPDLQVVPIMVVGENLLIGGTEITDQLPGIIETGLENGGIDWVELEGLSDAIEQLVVAPTEPAPTDVPAQEATQAVAPTASKTDESPTQDRPVATASSEDPTTSPSAPPIFNEPKFSVLDRIQMDPAGNSVAIVVLIGMVISIAIIGSRLIYPESTEETNSISWLIPLLSLIGIGVATYLTYVEASGTEAICGPVGDCNTVQESKYALLFGIIPVGAVGLVGYVAIILAWIAAKFGPDPIVEWAKIAMLGMSIIGTLFSIYLTFLEPFVIGATCAWCITSALIITILMWLSLRPGSEALVGLRGKDEEFTS